MALRCGQAGVEGVAARDGADGGAVAAAGALVDIDVARVLADDGAEVARLAVHALDIGAGHDLDVGVAARLHQVGREDAHGAVVGGEGLVELRHAPADGRAVLDQVDLEPGRRQVERSLHAADAGADNQN